MGIIETKADELMALINSKKSIAAKDAAENLHVDVGYVRRLAKVFQKNKLIDLKANSFSLTMIAKKF